MLEAAFFLKDRYLSLTLQILGMLCILFSFNVVHLFPLQSKHKLQKEKRPQLIPYHPGSGPWWSPCPCRWFIKFSLLASKNQIFSCGEVLKIPLIINTFGNLRRIQLVGKQKDKTLSGRPTKKMKPWLNSLSLCGRYYSHLQMIKLKLTTLSSV